MSAHRTTGPTSTGRAFDPRVTAWLRQGPSRLVISYGIPTGAFLFAWDLWSRSFGSPQLFPSPWQTAATFAALIADGTLFHDAAASMGRILSGFAIGSLLGALLGLLMGSSRIIQMIVEPYVNFLRFVAGVAWISIFIVWFGTGETSKVVLIVYTTAFAVTLSTAAGVAAIAQGKIRAARCFGANAIQRFAWITTPATVPYIVTGMRLSLANAFLIIVAAEMVQADSGLGFVIIAARYYLAPDTVFCAMITLGILGLLCDRVLMLLARVLLGRYYRQN